MVKVCEVANDEQSDISMVSESFDEVDFDSEGEYAVAMVVVVRERCDDGREVLCLDVALDLMFK